MSQVSKRRKVRERVLQILFSFELNEDGLKIVTDSLLSDITDETDRNFATELVKKIIRNRKELDNKIGERVNNWEMNRIALIDKILLRIGLCEFLYFPDIPPKVSINESIEIAKIYSTAGSGKFINGILDSILSELKQKGEINKTGRGLVDETLSKSAKNKSGWK
jgi:N utilization substance protein B